MSRQGGLGAWLARRQARTTAVRVRPFGRKTQSLGARRTKREYNILPRPGGFAPEGCMRNTGVLLKLSRPLAYVLGAAIVWVLGSAPANARQAVANCRRVVSDASGNALPDAMVECQTGSLMETGNSRLVRCLTEVFRWCLPPTPAVLLAAPFRAQDIRVRVDRASCARSAPARSHS